MRLSRNWAVVAVALGMFLAAASPARAADVDKPAEPAAPAVKVGDQVENFSFKDIRFLERSLSEFGDKKAFVVVFTNLDCPLVKRYLPRVVELDRAYRDRGVQFLAVNVGANDPLVEVAYQAVKADAEFPFAKDFDGTVVRALGVERTPEVVVLDGDRRLRYRGRIDSQYRLSGVKPNAGREDLKEAIEDVLAGREVSVATTTVDGCRITLPTRQTPTTAPTYGEHVAAILTRHCQECHRPGTTAPFSLLSFEDAQSNAETIAEVVREKRMPPCFASHEQTEIVNRKELSPEEIRLVLDWVSGGTQPGDLSKAPAPFKPANEKWLIGHEPDLVITMPKAIKIPAQGYVPYKYVILPHKFEEDTWVQKIEVLPGNHAAVHHCNLVAAVGSKVSDANFITGYVPGGDPMVLNTHEAFRIPKGSRLVLQLHYVTTGEETTDQTSVGLVFPREKVQKEISHFQVNDQKFVIPAGAPHHRVVAERTFKADATGIGMFSHMHLRGKDMVFNAIYPDGHREVLLAIPNYDFNWQMAYRWAAGTKKFPKGTKIECVAHFDNSTFNPYNPDSTQEVRNGQQTFQEMMYGFFFFTYDEQQLDLEIDPKSGRVVSGTAPPAEEQASAE